MSQPSIGGLEHHRGTLDEQITTHRARVTELADAIARGRSAPSDFADMQHEQLEIVRLTNEIAAVDGVLKVMDAARQKVRAEERATAAQARRQQAYEAAGAILDQIATLADEREADFARFVENIRRGRELMSQLGIAVGAIGNDQALSAISLTLGSLLTESDNLARFLVPIGGGLAVDVKFIPNSGAVTRARADALRARIRGALDVTDTPTSTTTED